jgi:hypothetical protein
MYVYVCVCVCVLFVCVCVCFFYCHCMSFDSVSTHIFVGLAQTVHTVIQHGYGTVHDHSPPCLYLYDRPWALADRTYDRPYTRSKCGQNHNYAVYGP